MVEITKARGHAGAHSGHGRSHDEGLLGGDLDAGSSALRGQERHAAAWGGRGESRGGDCWLRCEHLRGRRGVIASLGKVNDWPSGPLSLPYPEPPLAMWPRAQVLTHTLLGGLPGRCHDVQQRQPGPAPPILGQVHRLIPIRLGRAGIEPAVLQHQCQERDSSRGIYTPTAGLSNHLRVSSSPHNQ